MGWTPCEVPNNDGTYSCPYSDDPISEMCVQCDWEHNERKAEEDYHNE